jgi:hypothetical protein
MASEPPFKTPPYTSYVSFKNYLDHLSGHPLPSRIDKSVMSHLNHGTQQALMATMRALGLLGEGDAPTTDLELLLESDGEDRQGLLQAMLKSTYPYFWDGTIDLGRATSSEFFERLRSATGAQGSTLDKASGFFFGLAADAGLELSPHLSSRKVSGSGTRKPRSKRKVTKAPEAQQQEQRQPPASTTIAMTDRLMEKFPTFDPAWPDEIKTQWFAAFERLMTSAEKSEPRSRKGPRAAHPCTPRGPKHQEKGGKHGLANHPEVTG